MKKIIIISYFFPPCNLTASQRVNSWAKYLNRFGYYPIVVTRKWEKHITSFDDCHYPTSKEVLIETQEYYEVHYCPYSSNLRDRLHVQKKLPYFKKFLSLIEIIFQNILIKLCPFNNFIDEAENIIKSEKKIYSIIISGNPFIQFKFGYHLSKKYKIPWIADYRDAWTTSTINNIDKNIIPGILNKYNEYFEKKWVSTASYIIASSGPISESVTKLTGVLGSHIYNGYEPDDFINIRNVSKSSSIFQITYVGTLYNGQDISIFVKGFKSFINKTNANVILQFKGIKLVPLQYKHLCKLLKGYESYFSATDRIPKNKMLKIERQSHLLLHVGWKGHSGIIASKIYEYIGSGTKLLVVPGDKGAIDSIVSESKCGIITNTSEETCEFLCNEYNDFINGKLKANNTSSNEVMQFTRLKQTERLGQIVNNLLR